MNLLHATKPDPAEASSNSTFNPLHIPVQPPSPGRHSSTNPAQPCKGFWSILRVNADILGGSLHCPSSQYPLQHSPELLHALIPHRQSPSEHGAPQQSVEALHDAPIMHAEIDSVLRLDQPKTSAMKLEVTFLSVLTSTARLLREDNVLLVAESTISEVHFPSLEFSLQHYSEWPQLSPSFLHCDGVLHIPLSQFPLQHSPEALQATSLLLQAVVAAHAPFWQV